MMNMKSIKYIFTSVACVAVMSISANAQDLKKEIVIDKDIVPELKESNRKNVTPQVPPLKIKHSQLQVNDRAKTVVVPGDITVFEPVENVDTMKLSNYRGYAALGYFPIYNMGLSGGYRFIEKQDMKLNAWMQYNGKTYDAKRDDGKELSMKDHELVFNVKYAQRVNEKSTVNATARYSYNNFFCPWHENGFTQSVNQFGLDGQWKSSIEGLKYDVDAGYSYFGYGKDPLVGPTEHLEAVNEHGGYIKARGGVEIDDNSGVGLELGASFLRYNQIASPDWICEGGSIESLYKKNKGYDNGLLTAIPHYELKTDGLSAKLGARLDYELDINNKIRFAPDVRLDWDADSIVSAYARLTGGSYKNTLASVFEVSHYFSPAMGYSYSYIPFALEMGVNIGPFKGGSIEVYGGYAKANDWYMPLYVSEGYMNNIMHSVDMSGWHLGAALSYAYKNLFKVKASYEAAPQSYDNGYYLWRDRATSVFKFSGSTTPFDLPLELTLDYEYRGGRSTYAQCPTCDNVEGVLIYETSKLSLGSKNCLSLGGLYKYTDQLSFFARVENLFNNKYDLLYDIQSQGITGMIGATYKF